MRDFLARAFGFGSGPFDRVEGGAPGPVEAARNGRRSRGVTRIAHINATAAQAPSLRERARAACINNPWLSRGTEAMIANLVGDGIVPRPQHPDPAVRERLAALFLAWTDAADAEGMTDFYGLQAAVARALVVDGESFVRFRPRDPGTFPGPVPLQLQVLPAEMIDEGLNQELGDGRRIRAGIELDAEGRRLAYHIRRAAPGETAVSYDVERVPATDVLHVMRPLGTGQVRGLSWLAPSLARASVLDAYEDAELERQRVAALFAGFVRRAEGDPFGPDATADGEGNGLVPLEPGIIQYLDDGEEITFPQVPEPLRGDFATRHLRAMAAGLGVTFEQLSGDLSGVNYSSIRSGLIEFRRRVGQIQHGVLVFQLCRPIWDRWVRTAILAGALDGTGPDELAALRAVKWLPPRWDWVDPLKDANAEIAQIAAGLKSRSEALSERGYDVEQVDAEIKADRDREERLGLDFRRAPASARAPAAPQEPADE